MDDLKTLLAVQKRTGASIAACRAALSSAGGDPEGAVELITREVDPALLAFFDESTWFTGPSLTTHTAEAAERELGCKLPRAYVDLLRQKNGGVPRNTCFPVDEATSWAADHILLSGIRGIGGKYGIEPRTEAQLNADWGYPAGLVFAQTPTAGHTVVMFDHSLCGPEGEPRVIWVDTRQAPAKVLALAQDFSAFIHGLVHEDSFESQA